MTKERERILIESQSKKAIKKAVSRAETLALILRSLQIGARGDRSLARVEKITRELSDEVALFIKSRGYLAALEAKAKAKRKTITRRTECQRD